MQIVETSHVKQDRWIQTPPWLWKSQSLTMKKNSKPRNLMRWPKVAKLRQISTSYPVIAPSKVAYSVSGTAARLYSLTQLPKPDFA
jgi:hypothetical protein